MALLQEKREGSRGISNRVRGGMSAELRGRKVSGPYCRIRVPRSRCLSI